MTTCLGKSCSFGLPRVPFVNCCQFMYLVVSVLDLRAGCGIWLHQFMIIAYLFTMISNSKENLPCSNYIYLFQLLNRCRMCNQTMEQLASLVRTNKTLRKLDLSGKCMVSRTAVVSRTLTRIFSLDHMQIWASSWDHDSFRPPYSSNAHAQPSSGARCQIIGRTLRLHLYFMCATSEGSGETARMRRIA